jgi:hypothetical protein
MAEHVGMDRINRSFTPRKRQQRKSEREDAAPCEANSGTLLVPLCSFVSHNARTNRNANNPEPASRNDCNGLQPIAN